MKKPLTLLKTVAIAVLIAGCGETGKESDPEVTPKINIPEDIFTSGISVESTSQSVALNFSSNVAWSATVSADWITISPSSGEAGNNSVKVNVEENTAITERTATITLKTDDGKAAAFVKVTQDATDVILKIDQSCFTVESEGGTITVKLTYNIDYTISQPDWISLKAKTTGEDTDTLTFNVTRNSGFNRKESIVFNASKAQASIIVSQYGSKKNGDNDDTSTGDEITVE